MQKQNSILTEKHNFIKLWTNVIYSNTHTSFILRFTELLGSGDIQAFLSDLSRKYLFCEMVEQKNIHSKY